MRKFFVGLAFVVLFAPIVFVGAQEARKLPKTVEFNGKEITVPNPVPEGGWVVRKGNTPVVLRERELVIIYEADKKESDIIVGRAEEFLRISNTLVITGKLTILYDIDSKGPVTAWWTIADKDTGENFTILFQEGGRVVVGTDGGSEPIFEAETLVGIRHFVISDGKRIAERVYKLPVQEQKLPQKDQAVRAAMHITRIHFGSF